MARPLKLVCTILALFGQRRRRAIAAHARFAIRPVARADDAAIIPRRGAGREGGDDCRRRNKAQHVLVHSIRSSK